MQMNNFQACDFFSHNILKDELNFHFQRHTIYFLIKFLMNSYNSLDPFQQRIKNASKKNLV